MRIHRCLSTHLYGTQQAGLITGSSLTITGTSACAIPVGGWFVGPTLIAGRMRLSFLFSPKGIHIPERGKFFVWFNSGSKKFYWQRIEIESGIQAPLTRKAKKLIGIQYRGIGIHRLKYRSESKAILDYLTSTWGDFFDTFPWPFELFLELSFCRIVVRLIPV